MAYNPLELFGAHLSKLRKAKGWSQELLALNSGLARSYVGGIERGQRNLSLINICVLADTLGVSPQEMLNFSQVASVKSAADTSGKHEKPKNLGRAPRKPHTA